MFDRKKSAIWCAFTVSLLIVGCSPSPDGGETDAKAELVASSGTRNPVARTAQITTHKDQLAIIVRADGLLVETPGQAQALKFGQTTAKQAEEALAPLGPPLRSSNGECPAGPLDFMDWGNGLQLAFHDGQLAGWWASNKARGIATASGLRPGTLRADIRAARIEDASIGKVFTVDGVNGILDDETASNVAALWAGAACIFS